jgi:D-amino peptidase
MKFMVAVDCEGVACTVGNPNLELVESPQWEWIRKQATREADAAVKGLFDAGATQVIIWDNHWRSLNLHYDDIDERADIAMGVGVEHRWPGMDSTFAGIGLIGYHSMDNVKDAVLAHSYSPSEYQYIKINGVEVGEIEIDAAMAGLLNVPLVFLSSDDKGVAETKRFMPWVETVAVKQGMGWNMALSKHPKRACSEIRQGTAQAARRIKEMKPFRFDEPLTVEIRFKRIEFAQGTARSKTGWEWVDAYTCRRKLQKLAEMF